jgi:hypothetical protein
MSLEVSKSEKPVKSTTSRVNPIDRLSSVSSEPGEIKDIEDPARAVHNPENYKLYQYVSGYDQLGKQIYSTNYLTITQAKKLKAVEVLDAVA